MDVCSWPIAPGDRHWRNDRKRGARTAAITEAIIGLARGLGLKVVAEGVGSREQLEFLDTHGFDSFQGFWMSKPLPADEFVAFVAGRK